MTLIEELRARSSELHELEIVEPEDVYLRGKRAVGAIRAALRAVRLTRNS